MTTLLHAAQHLQHKLYPTLPAKIAFAYQRNPLKETH